MVSCSVRWKRIAFSIAIAHGSTRVSTSWRSARVKGPPCLLMISRTPIVCPRETSGAQRIERVSNCVRVSTWAEKWGSRAVSFTIAGLPLWATQPATPSPIFSRTAETSRAFAPSAASNTSSCFSSSTIISDQASEGMSCRIFSTTSSMTLRGSRIELAVLTTSVRMARRRAVVWGGEVPSPRPRAERRAASRWARTVAGRGSEGRQASTTKSRPRRWICRSARASGATARPPTGRPGRARRTALTARGDVRPSTGRRAPAKRSGSSLARPGAGRNSYSRAPRASRRRLRSDGPPPARVPATCGPGKTAKRATARDLSWRP